MYESKLISRFVILLPSLQVNDTVKVDLATGKVVDFVKFEMGNLAIITRGRNGGRVGVIQHIERCVTLKNIFYACLQK